jgi:hypothetical protein
MARARNTRTTNFEALVAADRRSATLWIRGKAQRACSRQPFLGLALGLPAKWLEFGAAAVGLLGIASLLDGPVGLNICSFSITLQGSSWHTQSASIPRVQSVSVPPWATTRLDRSQIRRFEPRPGGPVRRDGCWPSKPRKSKTWCLLAGLFHFEALDDA